MAKFSRSLLSAKQHKYYHGYNFCYHVQPHLIQFSYHPSSCPPRDTRYLSFGENASASTLTLCSGSRVCFMVPLSKSHTITSALNPMWVFSPDARYFPLLETARQETARPLSPCPDNNLWRILRSSGVFLFLPLTLVADPLDPEANFFSSFISSTTILLPSG